VDPVSRLDQVLQLIGRQMSERSARLDSGARLPPPKPAGRPQQRETLAALRRRFRERLGQIAADDPNRAEKARRAFVESVLAWQFGKELLLEPGFEDTVRGVQEAMRASPDFEARFARMLNELANAAD
jgi:hypothetical protein